MPTEPARSRQQRRRELDHVAPRGAGPEDNRQQLLVRQLSRATREQTLARPSVRIQSRMVTMRNDFATDMPRDERRNLTCAAGPKPTP